MVVAPLLGLSVVVGLETGSFSTLSLFGFEIKSVVVDKQAKLFGYLFHVAALVAGIYSFHIRDRWQVSMALLYAASAVGVAFAGDMLSLFLWWEALALTSVFQIWGRRTKEAEESGFRYLFFHVSSGLLLLAGIIIRYHGEGETAFSLDPLTQDLEAGDLGALLILLAVGIKAAFPGHHAVEDEEIEPQARHALVGFPGFRCHGDAESIVTEVFAQQITQAPIVVDDQDMRRVVRQHSPVGSFFLFSPFPCRLLKALAILIVRHDAEQDLAKPIDRRNSRRRIGSGNPLALVFRQAFFQHFPLFGQTQQPLSSIAGSLRLLDKALTNELAEDAVQALFGDFQDVEKGRYGQTRVAADEINGTVVGAPEP